MIPYFFKIPLQHYLDVNDALPTDRPLFKLELIQGLHYDYINVGKFTDVHPKLKQMVQVKTSTGAEFIAPIHQLYIEVPFIYDPTLK